MEHRMRWLCQEFGLDRMLQTSVVLPTTEFFPDPYQGTEADARILFARMCGYLDVEVGRIQLGFYSEKGPELGEQFRLERAGDGTAGLYQRDVEERIWLEVSKLKHPAILAATMAHELGHVHLLGDGRLSRDEKDHEPLTDLLTVFFGLGVLTANAILLETREPGDQGRTWWGLSRQGYLSAPMYGYALALFAWVRDELKPHWARELRPDVRVPFAQGLRYLIRTEDCVFRREELPGRSGNG
jgi:hypothetical protein